MEKTINASWSELIKKSLVAQKAIFFTKNSDISVQIIEILLFIL